MKCRAGGLKRQASIASSAGRRDPFFAAETILWHVIPEPKVGERKGDYRLSEDIMLRPGVGSKRRRRRTSTRFRHNKIRLSHHLLAAAAALPRP
ncbi:hypothetical protein MPL1032_100046 [Mesorhizobium plurifarium]|uniref:Uncharacterized protein n=1 Tax=Mesorhizobium plurifarium TaxID=69974 RepID=A0A0K2VN24_MESPL|nr:hypothetical protein MPL1032_100046 [Mesorhizobium plurifarium]